MSKRWVMTVQRTRNSLIRRGSSAAALICAAALLGGCGTPAAISPTATPLPGLGHDVKAAQHAVAQTERDAQHAAAAGP
jgi:hypothetical protein